MRVMVIGGVPDPDEGDTVALQARLEKLSLEFGAEIAERRHELVACSPKEATFDRGAVQGALSARADEPLHLHFPGGRGLEDEWAQLGARAPAAKTFVHPAPASDDGWYGAWLFAQMRALDDAEVVVALGGKWERTANLLLLVAEARGQMVFPVPWLGGAAGRSFTRRYHELRDALGEDGIALLECDAHSGRGIVELVEKACARRLQGPGKPLRQGALRTFFVSYARDRHPVADAVEVALRRRGHIVHRDEHRFSPSEPIPSSISDWIHRSDVFVALWSREYACSPWCHDEMELALDRMAGSRMQLWMLRLDDTRVVPPRARALPHFDVRNREEVIAAVERLLGGALPEALYQTPPVVEG